MLALIKAEFRKLFTTRSTYFILGLAFALELLFAFYISGWKAKQEAFLNPNYVASQMPSAINVLMLLAGLIAVLLITHEYRYNTIMYTLTSSKSRTRVFAAKFFVIAVFAMVFALVYGWLSPFLTVVGAQLHGLDIVGQQIDVWNLTWSSVFGGWGFVMLASVMAMIIRAQPGAIAAMFLVPGIGEQLIGLLLKQNQVYLPFSALNVLLDVGNRSITHGTAALVGAAYLVGGLVVAWVLFLRRDAN